jgi:hypothetical protein
MNLIRRVSTRFGKRGEASTSNESSHTLEAESRPKILACVPVDTLSYSRSRLMPDDSDHTSNLFSSQVHGSSTATPKHRTTNTYRSAQPSSDATLPNIDDALRSALRSQVYQTLEGYKVYWSKSMHSDGTAVTAVAALRPLRHTDEDAKVEGGEVDP